MRTATFWSCNIIESQFPLFPRLTVYSAWVLAVKVETFSVFEYNVCLFICSIAPGHSFRPRTLKLGDNAQQVHIEKWFSGFFEKNILGEIWGGKFLDFGRIEKFFLSQDRESYYKKHSNWTFFSKTINYPLWGAWG